jgi:hypothetical protein
MSESQASVPETLVPAVVHLVTTGPVLLGAYTVAELIAVDAIVDFLEARPSDEVMAEAVRSLAARQLLAAGSDPGQVQIRGDLGIAVAFQRRARLVVDARATGTEPGEPWRVLLLPQPERICLMVRIDALGVHELGLYSLDEALDFMAAWLPKGNVADHDHDSAAAAADRLLAESHRSALVTVTPYTTDGSVEKAATSTDLILVAHDGRLHAFAPAAGDRTRLEPRPLDGEGVRDTLLASLADTLNP